MLKRFIYLDEPDLNEYISALEGGSRSKYQMKQSSGKNIEGGVDVKAVKLGSEKSVAEEVSIDLLDTRHSKFDRFVRLAEENADDSGWIEIMDADNDLVDVGIGALLNLECEIYVPDIVKSLSSAGELTAALDMLDNVMPAAEVIGLDMTGLPDRAQTSAMREFVGAIGQKLVVVGELDDSDWVIAGEIQSAVPTDELEGRVRLVGKVKKIIKPGNWHPLMALPGSNLLPRAQRRELERKPPEQGKEDEYLHGPALLLNILAIYR